jgi:uncharacterized protein (DUF305 family)
MSRLREENQTPLKYALVYARVRQGPARSAIPLGGTGYSEGMRSATAVMLAAVMLAVGVLAACGNPPEHRGTGSSTAQGSEAANHNAADITFARNMVAHHKQGVQMAQIVPTNTTNQQIIALANEIIATQVPEIQAFTAWLMQWQDTQDTQDARSHDNPGMPGMVDEATMGRLQSLTGAEFDRLWLTSMIGNHRGAVAMAQDELAHGRNADVMYLARTIIANQQAEIDRMQHMLGG